MLLHGHEISKFDSVYDLSRGDGRVIRVGNLNFTVEFGDGIQVAYASDGRAIGSGRASLYFQSPITVVPPRDEAQWNKEKALIASVIAAVRDSRG